jgi:hypothetical protein
MEAPAALLFFIFPTSALLSLHSSNFPSSDLSLA